MTEILKAKENDLEQILKIYDHSFSEVTQLDNARIIIDKTLHKSDYTLLVAKDTVTKELVGFLMCTVIQDFTENCKPTMLGCTVCVAEHVRCTGIGTALIKEMEAVAYATSCKSMLIFLGSHRAEALSLFKKLGFDIEAKDGLVKILE